MKIAVVSTSCEVHAKNISEVLNKILKPKYNFQYLNYDSMYDSGYELVDFSQFDVLLNIGYFIPVGVFLESVYRAEPDLKIVNCWVGSDILQNIGHVSAGMGQHRDAAKHYINIADSPKFVRELEVLLGIEGARAVKTCPKRLFEPIPLPALPNILVYMPMARRNFYNFETIMEVASLAMDVKFTILSHPEPKEFALPNVVWREWLTGEAYDNEIKKATATIRMPLHDGISVTSLEMASAGRYVISNQPGAPTTHHAEKLLEIYEAVREVAQLKEPNVEGSEWVRTNFSPEVMAESYREILASL